MSTLTKVVPLEKAKPPLTLPQAALVLFLALNALGLFAAELTLKFALDDLRQETHRLQARGLELRSEVNLLKGEVQAQKRGDRLLHFARNELGLAQLSPGEEERLILSPALVDRYAVARLLPVTPGELTPVSAGDSLAGAVTARLGWTSQAQAAPGEDTLHADRRP